MDVSTLLIVFLLVSAATLASYALNHWRWARGIGGAGWAAASIGTTLLLIAAAIIVLTFAFRGALWPPPWSVEQALRGSAARTSEASARAAPVPTIDATATRKSAADAPSRPAGHRDPSEVPRPADGISKQSSSPSSQPSAAQNNPTPSSAALPVFADIDPWAATSCVHVFNPDLGEPTRWKIENGCDVPVGVVLSYCTASSSECNAHASTAWRYPSPGMIFPAALQRPITHDEQTLYAQKVRYAACFASSPWLVHLIGAPAEERSTTTWREQFESARLSDGCLTRIQSWSSEGRRTRLPADVLLGVSTQLTER